MGATPPVVDRSSESSSNGKAKGHPDHRGEPGCSPRSLVEKGQRDGIVGTLGKVRDEVNPLAIDGSTRADGDDDEAHAQHTQHALIHNTPTRAFTRSINLSGLCSGLLRACLWPGSVVSLCFTGLYRDSTGTIVWGSVWSWDSRSVSVFSSRLRLCARPVCVCRCVPAPTGVFEPVTVGLIKIAIAEFRHPARGGARLNRHEASSPEAARVRSAPIGGRIASVFGPLGMRLAAPGRQLLSQRLGRLSRLLREISTRHGIATDSRCLSASSA